MISQQQTKALSVKTVSTAYYIHACGSSICVKWNSYNVNDKYFFFSYGNGFSFRKGTSRFHWDIWLFLALDNWIFDFGRPIAAVRFLINDPNLQNFNKRYQTCIIRKKSEKSFQNFASI
jgi:hypothetical protein